VDKDNFDDVLKAQNVKVDITVPNKLSKGEEEEEMGVSLNFESMKDFSPEAIVKNSPELNKLLELREALGTLKGPLSNIPAFRKKLQELVKDDAAREKLLKEIGMEEKGE
jgi:type VI secretion system protein ImpB